MRCSGGPNQVNNADGTCTNCEDYEYPNASQTECLRPSCDFNQYISVAGLCTKCPEYQEVDG